MNNMIWSQSVTSAEAQVFFADIARNSHDLHDVLRAELFSLEELSKMPIRGLFEVDRKYPALMRNDVHTKP